MSDTETTDGTRIRSRSRPSEPDAPKNDPAASQSGGDDSGDWMKRGAAARRTTDKELAANREKERRRAEGIFMPYRFWLPVGKQTEIIVLDAEPGPCFYEHNLKDPGTGKWDVYEGCPKEFEPCPLCDGVAGGKESYYVMLLSIIALDPYVNKDGKTIPHSKKLLAVKTNDQPFFNRLFEREGTLRGAHLLMARDSKNSANHGRPELIEMHKEEDILATFGHPEIKAQDGRVIKKQNADCYPYPYEKIFTRPSATDLRTRYGGAAPAGSADDIGGGSAAGGSRITARGGAAGDAPPSGGAGATDDLDDDIPF